MAAGHGTWWYALWAILASGLLLESNDTEQGHEFWEPGVYVTALVTTAESYGRPQRVFGDGMYHRVFLEVRYDPGQVRRHRQRGGVQIVLPSRAVAVVGVHFRPNAPPWNGEERLDDWVPQLEALPHGQPPRAV